MSRRGRCSTGTRAEDSRACAPCAKCSNVGIRRAGPRKARWRRFSCKLFRGNGLPEPVVQYDVVDASGHFVARTDAAYPDQQDRDRVRQQAGALGRVSGGTRRETAERAAGDRLRSLERTARRSAARRDRDLRPDRCDPATRVRTGVSRRSVRPLCHAGSDRQVRRGGRWSWSRGTPRSRRGRARGPGRSPCSRRTASRGRTTGRR